MKRLEKILFRTFSVKDKPNDVLELYTDLMFPRDIISSVHKIVYLFLVFEDMHKLQCICQRGYTEVYRVGRLHIYRRNSSFQIIT